MLVHHCFETRSHWRPFFSPVSSYGGCDPRRRGCLSSRSLSSMQCALRTRHTWERDNCGCTTGPEIKCSLCVHSVMHQNGQLATTHTHVLHRLSVYCPPTHPQSFSNTTKFKHMAILLWTLCSQCSCLSLHLFVFVCVPGNAPVGFDLQYRWVVCVVELHLRVPQLCKVNVHHHRSAADCRTRWSYTHNLSRAAPEAHTHTYTQVITCKQTKRKGKNLEESHASTGCGHRKSGCNSKSIPNAFSVFCARVFCFNTTRLLLLIHNSHHEKP